MLAQYEINRERDENIFVAADTDNVCPVHFHRKVEVMYVLSGEKRVSAAGKEIVLTRDNVYFANSYEMHGYEESAATRCTAMRRAMEVGRPSSSSLTACSRTITSLSATN